MRRIAVAAALFLAAAPLLAQFHPNSDRGFAADKTYDFQGLDNVNLFNGNLIVAIPLGQRYHAGGTLDYGVTLVYNSNVWDFITDVPNPVSVPNRRSNAGIGWEVSFGAIIPPTDPVNETRGGLGEWIFESPDGAHHLMAGDGTGTLYSHDGSYLRMTPISASTWRVEAPDGRLYDFYDYAGDGSDWRVQRIADRANNSLSFDYTLAAGDVDTWTLTDSQGRRQVLHFSDAAGTTYGGKLLTSVSLSAFGGATAQVQIQYQLLTVNSGRDNGSPIAVQVLKSITLPGAAASYAAADQNGTLYYDTSGVSSGVMTRLYLPTGGSIRWTYTLSTFPSTSAPRQRTTNVAVWERTLVDTDGSVLGRWSYEHHLDQDSRCQVLCEKGGAGCWSGEGRQKVTVVRSPSREGGDSGTRDTAIHYYSVYSSGSDFCANDDGWSDGEYGMPYTRYATDGAGRFLASDTRSDVPDGDFGGGSTNWVRKGSIPSEGTVRRSGYSVYEHEPVTTYEDPWNTNRRESSSSLHYDDDSGCGGICAVATDRSAFDGHGHYAQAVQTSSFPASVPRTTFTSYITNPVSWIWGLSTETCAVDQQTTITQCDGLASAVTVKTSYDTATGQLLGRRTLAGSALGANDVLTLYTYTSNGEVAAEKTYGGDGAQLDTSTPFPAPATSPQYELDHSYTYTGPALTRHTAAFRDSATGQPMPFFTTDDDYDAATGLVAHSRDTAGAQTDFTYDAQSRLTFVKPPAGAHTKYTYNDAVPGAAASVVEQQYDSLDSNVLTQQTHTFDGVGRLLTTARLMPNPDPNAGGTIAATRTRALNGLGWVTRTSGFEATSSPVHFTSTAYDAFGRPTSITAPDGTSSSIAYAGTRQVARTVNGATTTETYDDRGRLLTVQEPSGLAGTQTTTAYAYDLGNRMRSATTTGSNTTQTRTFTYDNRGLLLNERHPEKGTTTYYEYDAGGHVTHKFEGSTGGPFDLQYLYDAAGRLTAVQDLAADGSRRPVKEFAFATANNSTDMRKGRLLSATRHNYDTAMGSDVTVTQTYAYADPAGRLTSRITSIGTTASYPSAPSFLTSQTWTDLGPATLSYPSLCTTSSCSSTATPRRLAYTYHSANRQLLQKIDGWANSISYNADGTMNRLVHGNYVIDWILPDPNGMARPCEILVGSPNTMALTADPSATCGYDVPYDAYWSSGQYAYDGAGNITGIGTWSYQYDAVNRITGAHDGTQSGETFAYDVFGNVTSHTGQTVAVSSATNRLTASGTTYDAAGNLTQTQESGSGMTTQYHNVWDGIGTLRESYSSTAPTNGVPLPFVRGTDRYYLYDADDERIATVTANAGDAFTTWPPPPSGGDLPFYRVTYTLRGFGNEVLRTVVDSLDFTKSDYGIAVQDTPIPRYSLGLDYIWRQPGQLLAVVRPDNSTGTTYARTYHLDHLGTARLITDASAQLADQLSYSAFGYGGVLDDSVQYAGMERDASGPRIADYDHARYYDAGGGRFWSVDPELDLKRALPRPQTWNRYAYVVNQPTKFTDPTGRAPGDGCSGCDDVDVGMPNPFGVHTNPSFYQGDEIGMAIEGHARQIQEAAVRAVGFMRETAVNWAMVFVGPLEGGAGAGRLLGTTTLREARTLIGVWARDPVQNTIAASLRYHFGEHGGEVGAKNMLQYLRKAYEFSKDLRGAGRAFLDGGKIRYMKNGRYIILDAEGRIVSFGALR